MLNNEYDDHVAKEILVQLKPPFYALIRAAILKADPENRAKLYLAFPALFIEVKGYDPMDHYDEQCRIQRMVADHYNILFSGRSD